MPGVHPSNPRSVGRLGPFRTIAHKSSACHHIRKNAPVTPFPATHPERRGVAQYFMFKPTNSGAAPNPSTNRIRPQHSCAVISGRWVHRFFIISPPPCPDGINDASMPASPWTPHPKSRMIKGVRGPPTRRLLGQRGHLYAQRRLPSLFAFRYEEQQAHFSPQARTSSPERRYTIRARVMSGQGPCATMAVTRRPISQSSGRSHRPSFPANFSHGGVHSKAALSKPTPLSLQRKS